MKINPSQLAQIQNKIFVEKIHTKKSRTFTIEDFNFDYESYKKYVIDKRKAFVKVMKKSEQRNLTLALKKARKEKNIVW